MGYETLIIVSSFLVLLLSPSNNGFYYITITFISDEGVVADNDKVYLLRTDSFRSDPGVVWFVV